MIAIIFLILAVLGFIIDNAMSIFKVVVILGFVAMGICLFPGVFLGIFLGILLPIYGLFHS